MIIKQSLNGIGITGAIFAIGGPLATIAIASWSATGIVETLTNRFSYRSPDDFLIHPMIYSALIALSVAGWIMVIVGRTYEITRPVLTSNDAMATKPALTNEKVSAHWDPEAIPDPFKRR